MSGVRPTSPALAAEWARAGNLLGVDIVAPFSVHLPSGDLVADVLVEGFGDRNGMLIITDFAKVETRLSELSDAGFGFSVLSEPDASDAFVLDVFVEVLQDWGWAGREEDAPAWLAEPRPED